MITTRRVAAQAVVVGWIFIMVVAPASSIFVQAVIR